MQIKKQNKKQNLAHLKTSLQEKSTLCSVLAFCLPCFLTRSLDEEDDVISHHDLVVVLHASKSGSDLGLLERSRAVLVDVSHQSVQAHRLSVCSTEDLQQRGFELLQPAKHTHQTLQQKNTSRGNVWSLVWTFTEK